MFYCPQSVQRHRGVQAHRLDLDDRFIVGGRGDTVGIERIGRGGDFAYVKVAERFLMDRPKWD